MPFRSLRTGNPKRPILFAGIPVVLTALTAMIGCSPDKSGWEVTHPASGVITYKGQPIVDAEVAFYPEDQSAPDTVRPRAKTTEGGKFEVWTYTHGDGIPAGNYKVTVVHNEVSVSKGTIVAKPNSLPAKYARVATTQLTVPITAGPNDLQTIDLK